VVFLLGEFVKLGLTVALLVVVIKWVEPIRWLALLTGLIVALKMPLFVPLVARPAVEKDECPGGESGGA
jgi:F0F1-type ATP synthase assembly protein I